MNFKHVISLVLLTTLFVATTESSRSEDSPPPPNQTTTETKIEADKANMDFSSGIATFEGNVIVTDKDATIHCDVLIAHVTKDNELTSMEAKGNVVIIQQDSNRRATSGYAHYDVATRKIVLKDKPRLEIGENILDKAKIITYFLDSERIFTEGTREDGARTTITLPGGTGDRGLSIKDDTDE